MNTSADFDTLLQQAWARHADDAAAVAAWLAGEAPAAARSADQVGALAGLVHHVCGEHLARWAEGRALLRALGAHPAADDESRAAVRRFSASLALGAGDADDRAALGRSDRLRVGAMAAASLAPHDTTRALLLLQETLADAEQPPLDAADPANRALAVAGNNLACTLEEKTGRSAAERELMILAAQTGRRYWERAGTWLETERAEYRLAMTWLQAGDAAQARRHAQACAALVQANAGAVLEHFFAQEALARAEHAAGEVEALAAALRETQESFDRLDDDDRGFCRATLDGLLRLPHAPHAQPR
jgi:hypothetical protein